MEPHNQNGTSHDIKVLMLPWLAHGHISPFLELAKKLTKRNFHVYFCSTAINLSSVEPKISRKYSNSIQLVELHLPSLPELPPRFHTTKGLPPHLMSTLKTAFDMSSPSFLNILQTYRPDLLIYDFLQPWAPPMASSLNIPAVNFVATAALTVVYVVHLERNSGAEFPFRSVYAADNFKIFGRCLGGSSNGVKELDRAVQCFERSSDVVLVKTLEEIEGKYMDFLSLQLNKKIVPVGPLVEEDAMDEDQENTEENTVIRWLNNKEKSSPITTIFVSFGTEYFLTKQQREELAYGLEQSNVDFIWVVRFPKGEKLGLEEALPKGFLERVKERGLVVEDWAPQKKILGHKTIVGFVSHCGWSSVMESMEFGVPIIAMPMNIDQPLNARLVEEMGVGVEVKRGESRKFEREEIGKTIRAVVAEKGGGGVREKAREMSREMREKGEEEIEGTVGELVKLCRID